MISMNLDVYHFYALALRNSTLVSPRRTRKLADAGPIESLGASLSLSLSLTLEVLGLFLPSIGTTAVARCTMYVSGGGRN